jgi:hypothetical protein
MLASKAVAMPDCLGLIMIGHDNVRVCPAFPVTPQPLTRGLNSIPTQSQETRQAIFVTEWSACRQAILRLLTKLTAAAASPPRAYATWTPAPTMTPPQTTPTAQIPAYPTGNPMTVSKLMQSIDLLMQSGPSIVEMPASV